MVLPISKKTRYALYGAGASFIVVIALLAASIGVAAWFNVNQQIRYEERALGNSEVYRATLSTTSKYSTSVHGRVIQEYRVIMELKENLAFVGSFSCNLKVDWNYWLERKDDECGLSVDTVLPDHLKAYGRSVCSNFCPMIRSMLANPNCGILSAAVGEMGVTNTLSVWEERAVCSGAKGILSVLVLALISGTVGMVMSCCCHSRPRLMIIPGVLVVVLSAISVVAYGAAISSAYPYDAARLEDLRVMDDTGVKNVSSGVSTVQSGFGLAIAAAVVALVSCLLAWIAGYIGFNDGTEMQVISAVPIQIYQPEAQPQEAQEAHVQAAVVDGVLLDNNPPLATAHVVVGSDDPSHLDTTSPTPHTESRIVLTSPASNGSNNLAGLAHSVQLPQGHSDEEDNYTSPAPPAYGHSRPEDVAIHIHQ